MVSRRSACSHDIIKNFEEQTDTRKASGVHKKKDMSAVINLIVNQLRKSNVFKDIPGRIHQSYPFCGMNMEEVRDWISNSLNKYSAKHFLLRIMTKDIEVLRHEEDILSIIP